MVKPFPVRWVIAEDSTEPKAVNSVLDLVGDTPLLQIHKIAHGLSPGVRIFAKLEGLNPGGSVKDRPSLKMVQEGIRSGKLSEGKTIIDSTSGNTGIALALIGRVLGYPVELVMPSNVSTERKRIIAALGANIVFSDPLEGSDGAIRLCRKILEENPEKYFKPDQYFNPMNTQAHYETTGPEIYRQTNREVTHFIAGIGTGGTIMGTGRYLKEMNPRIRVIAVEPDDALHGLEGLKHMASSIVPGIYHEEEVDEKIAVSTEDAYAMVYRLSQEEGVLVGQSAGAAMYATLQVARKLRSGTLVTVFPDFGDKYLTTNLWVGWRDKMSVGNLNFSI
ncbi:MAG: PLP-dependent cysteine synthase family protein [Deltaproteobacteria bacterium]|nr:PLP-dependent cysteine synthase family protein [Deltaproteobacteria bacterium]